MRFMLTADSERIGRANKPVGLSHIPFRSKDPAPLDGAGTYGAGDAEKGEDYDEGYGGSYE